MRAVLLAVALLVELALLAAAWWGAPSTPDRPYGCWPDSARRC
ncbi:hypothetical protein [Micromonospora sp. CPCC 205556]